jgi:ribosomal protein S18 acetylase RimI-like enzyme
LAFQSGEYSRFNIDPNFGVLKFKELYKTWIDKSIAGQEADYVSVIQSKNKAIGFATVKIVNNVGVVGLIAVNDEQRGKGIGKILMKNIFTYLKSQGITTIEVATQYQNKQACTFYESFKMNVKSKTTIYHLWL